MSGNVYEWVFDAHPCKVDGCEDGAGFIESASWSAGTTFRIFRRWVVPPVGEERAVR